MGPKITVDSATLANKGLEVIEAHFLFGVAYEQVEVVIQPTSVVHALVRFRDGAPLDLASGLRVDFEPVDHDAFPLLGLARRAGEQGGTYACAFNAANEVGVAAFLEGRLPFLGIAEVVEETLEQVDGAPAANLGELVAADEEARRAAERGMALA